MSVAALAAPLLVSAPAAAQTGAKPASRTTPMHPHQLTLYPHGKPQRRHPAYSYSRHQYDHPTTIHNTFMGQRY